MGYDFHLYVTLIFFHLGISCGILNKYLSDLSNNGFQIDLVMIALYFLAYI